jgi:hypothetical protein
MEIHCKACRAACVLYDSPFGAGTFARCPRCRAVLGPEPTSSAVATTTRLPSAMRFFDSGERLLPEAGGYRMPATRTDGGELVVVRRWFSISRLIGAIFLSALLSLAAFIPAAFFQAFFGWVGVAFVYGVAAYGVIGSLVNRTIITARAGTLTIRHGPLPLPWARSVTLRTERLGTIYSREMLARVPGQGYEVVARVGDGVTMTLVSFLPEPQHAIFIEQILETRVRRLLSS